MKERSLTRRTIVAGLATPIPATALPLNDSALETEKSTSGVTAYRTRAALEAAHVAANVNTIELLGYRAPNDGGRQHLRRVRLQPIHPAAIRSGDGTWWEITDTSIDPRMLGASVSGDDNGPAIIGALEVGRPVSVSGGTYKLTLTQSTIDTFFRGLNRITIDPASAVNVIIAAGLYTFEQVIAVRGRDLSRLTMSGAAPIPIQINRVISAQSSTFSIVHWDKATRPLNYHVVEYAISSVAGVQAGQFLIVETTTGRGDHQCHRGAWEIVDIDPSRNRIRVLMTTHSAPPTDGVTCGGVVLPSVIRFTDGTAMGKSALICESGAALGRIDNLAFVGTGRPEPDASGRGPNGYDCPGGAGGVTGLIVRDNSTLELGNRFAISGFSGTNASANRSGTLVTSGYSCNAARNGWSAAGASFLQAEEAVASGNLIDGFISQDTSFNFCISSLSIGNHRHGYISANNGSLNAEVTRSIGNRGDGYSCLLSRMNIIRAIAKGNSGSGLRAGNASNVRGTEFVSKGNALHGIRLDGASTFEGSLSDVSGNRETDYVAVGKSLATVIDFDMSGSPSFAPPANVISSDGSLIRTITRIQAFTLEHGIRVGQGTEIKRILSVGAALALPEIPAHLHTDILVALSGVIADGEQTVLVTPTGKSVAPGLYLWGFVSASDTVTVRCQNVSPVAIKQRSLNVRIRVEQY